MGLSWTHHVRFQFDRQLMETQWGPQRLTLRFCATGESDESAGIRITAEGPQGWSQVVDVTGGDRALMPFPPRVASASDHLFVLTEGEHIRGATHHHHQLHCLSETGRHCWSLAARVRAPVVRVAQGWLVLVRSRRNDEGTPTGFLELLHVRHQDGVVLTRWPLDTPPGTSADGLSLQPQSPRGWLVSDRWSDFETLVTDAPPPMTPTCSAQAAPMPPDDT